jgi:EAL domain-containing protein (putative c-di-GMP-specific phosphodiesterase class I)
VEGEQVSDGKWLAEILSEYKRIGFKTAIDDFGAGFAGLNLLADFHPDSVKLDMALIRGIDHSRSRRAIVAGVISMCDELDIEVIAEGIETADEARCLSDLGIRLMQGYWFGRPRFEQAAGEADIPWGV